jgi:uncharacterized protein Yka (UPF0111/DUF47 family)
MKKPLYEKGHSNIYDKKPQYTLDSLIEEIERLQKRQDVLDNYIMNKLFDRHGE